MNRLRYALIGFLLIQSSSYGMLPAIQAGQSWGSESKALPNAAQKEEAYNQFRTGEDQKSREEMVPVLLEHQKEGNTFGKRHVLFGASMLFGGAAWLYGMLRCTKSFDSTYIPTQIGLGASLVTPITGAVWTLISASIICDTNKTIKILEKKDKTKLDWYAIREMGKRGLRANTESNSTSKKEENMFIEDDPCELYNLDTKKSFAWNMQDPKCVKEVISGKYNSSSWMFRKTKKEEL